MIVDIWILQEILGSLSLKIHACVKIWIQNPHRKCEHKRNFVTMNLKFPVLAKIWTYHVQLGAWEWAVDQGEGLGEQHGRGQGAPQGQDREEQSWRRWVRWWFGRRGEGGRVPGGVLPWSPPCIQKATAVNIDVIITTWTGFSQLVICETQAFKTTTLLWDSIPSFFTL